MKVTVVGAGAVGATCAENITRKELCEEVVLLDIKEGLAEGLSDYSIEHPFLYGLLAALGAILAGYIGSEVFRRI